MFGVLFFPKQQVLILLPGNLMVICETNPLSLDPMNENLIVSVAGHAGDHYHPTER